VANIAHAPASQVWEPWTKAGHTTQCHHAFEEWHFPYWGNEVCPGGRFLFRMAAKEGSFNADFNGTHADGKINQ